MVANGTGERIAVVGTGLVGGGWAIVFARAGLPLGLKFRFLDPEPDSPCAQVGELLVGSYTDEALLDRFARDLDWHSDALDGNR